jgi:hypothetical protein
MHMLPAVKDVHEIGVTFALPCLHEHYATKADQYLSHLIGHEGPGSLMSALKARGWATDLVAGVEEDGYDCNSFVYLFGVTMTLTEAGLAAGPGYGLAPVALLFQYINMMRAAGGLPGLAVGGGAGGCGRVWWACARGAAGCCATALVLRVGGLQPRACCCQPHARAWAHRHAPSLLLPSHGRIALPPLGPPASLPLAPSALDTCSPYHHHHHHHHHHLLLPLLTTPLAPPPPSPQALRSGSGARWPPSQP